MKDVSKIEPLNVDGESFLRSVGITYNRSILTKLRELKLISFFKVGKKYYYPKEDIKSISDKLRNNEISIRTDNGYYVHINNQQ